jgi:hypothetical protein
MRKGKANLASHLQVEDYTPSAKPEPIWRGQHEQRLTDLHFAPLVKTQSPFYRSPLHRGSVFAAEILDPPLGGFKPNTRMMSRGPSIWPKIDIHQVFLGFRTSNNRRLVGRKWPPIALLRPPDTYKMELLTHC